ncbi:MAG: OmpA family protein [Burkholderiaceae bacterium]|nr:OmpA family protein [Sulfuritalea sp.]MCF8175882.1 OmpA family protein [Burkholderiaceae bacterium]
MKTTRLFLMTALVGGSLACGQVVAADSLRQTVSIDDRIPTAQEVEEALFPKGIQALKQECAQLEKAGMRCQSVVPKSALQSVLITFERGSSKLSDEARMFLKVVGTALQSRASSWTSLQIEGHSDITGTREINERLSQERADAAKAYLEANFGLKNIATVGRASDDLKDVENPTSVVNRRVAFIPEW